MAVLFEINVPASLASIFLAGKYTMNICHRVPSTMSSGEKAIGRGNSAQYVLRMRRSGNVTGKGRGKRPARSIRGKYKGWWLNGED